jgi:hypothetical protein
MRKLLKSGKVRAGGSLLGLAAVTVVFVVLILPATAAGARKGGNQRCDAQLMRILTPGIHPGDTLKVAGAHLNAGWDASPTRGSSDKGEIVYQTTKGKHGTTGTVSGGVLSVVTTKDIVSGPIWVGSSECTGTNIRFLHVG